MTVTKAGEVKVILAGMQGFAVKNFLPLAFAVAFVIALSYPELGQAIVAPQYKGVHIVTFCNICIVFFISGLTLRTDELKDAFSKRAVGGTLFAFASILGITPLLGFAVRMLQLQESAFVTGLTIFCVVPTTLGVGISLVTAAKGNVALSIFLTVGSNLLGVVTIPLWLKVMLSEQSSGVDSLNVDFLDIFEKLLISFLVPTALGKALRELVPAANAFQKAHKQQLSMLSNSMLAMLILQTLSSGRDIIVGTLFGDMLLVIVSVLCIHLTYLAFNTTAVMVLGVPLKESISAVIMASQKSAPVAVAVITYMTSSTRTQGVLAVPCVLGQLVQIFVGQPIALYLAGLVARQEASGAASGGSVTDPLLPVSNGNNGNAGASASASAPAPK